MKTRVEQQQSVAVSMLLQFIAAGLSLFVLTAIFVQTVNRIPYEVHKADFQETTPAMRQAMGKYPFNLSVGLTINDFPLFNMKDGQFVVDVSLFFVFDPLLITIERIGDFVFLNSEVLIKSQPFVKMVGSQLFVRYDLRLRFDFDLYYKRFPFEGHQLFFVLTHPHLTPSEVVYITTRTNYSINPEIVIPGWDLVDYLVATGFSENVLSVTKEEKMFSFHSPSAAFSMNFMRVGVRQSLTIFIPLLLLFLIAVFTLSFDPFEGLYNIGIGLSAAVVTALIGYRFVIESMSPKVGNLILSDFIFLVVLGVCCVIFLINVFSETISQKIKKGVVVLSHAIVVGTVWYYFILF